MPRGSEPGETVETPPAKGRPSKYTAKIADRICSELSNGRTLRSVCRDDGMPHESTVRAWVLDDLHGFYTQYTRAREIGYHSMADETLEIADDGTNDFVKKRKQDGEEFEAVDHDHIARSRLRFDARRWLLSKALPKIYGDKLSLAGDGENPLTVVIRKFSEGSTK